MDNIRKDTDIIGEAVVDYYRTQKSKRIEVISSITYGEYIDSAYLFRSYQDMPDLEQKALKKCHGHILDVGAGAGCHSLYLQQSKMDVSALDRSHLCCQVMKMRGINNVINEDYFDHTGKYDTIVMLMNGIGIAGTLARLKDLLLHTKELLHKNGQLIFDSSDIDYMYTEEDGSKWINLNSNYYGEVSYQLRYKKKTGDKFNWLFVDYETVSHLAEELGYSINHLAESEHFQYLASLVKKE